MQSSVKAGYAAYLRASFLLRNPVTRRHALVFNRDALLRAAATVIGWGV